MRGVGGLRGQISIEMIDIGLSVKYLNRDRAQIKSSGGIGNGTYRHVEQTGTGWQKTTDTTFHQMSPRCQRNTVKREICLKKIRCAKF